MPTPTTSSAVTEVVASGNALIDGLLSDYRWTSGHISYSFATVNSSWSTDPLGGYGDANSGGEPWTGLAALTSEDKAFVAQALTAAASVAGIDFKQVTESATSVGDLRFAYSSNAGGGYAAAYLPGNAPAAGDVWFDAEGQMATETWEPGSYHYTTVLHELGHALGLSHPFDEGDGEPSFGAPWDSRGYTVMSYSAQAGNQNSYYSFEPTTFMLLDVQALQYLYGADMAWHAGDDTYEFSSGGNYHQTIWDASGADTIRYSSSVGGKIDLREGGGSTLGNAVSITDEYGHTLVASVPNVWIAYDAVIENAVGGSGNDTLTGNGVANSLNGGAGADKMSGGNGSDTYYVDNSGDVVSESSADASSGGTDTVRNSIPYTLGANVENLRINASGSVNGTGNSLGNVLYAGAGNNVLDGGSGVDTASYRYAVAAVTASLATTASQATGASGSDKLLNFENLSGGDYNDVLTGNAAANVIDGRAGADKMTGGDGSDTYVVDNAGDLVKESNASTGSGGTDLVKSALSYTLGANVENLQLTASGSVNGTGNTLGNTLFAGAGNNVLNGGDGSDTVSYQYAGAAVKASLAITAAQATGGSASDTLVGIEKLIGSNYNDTLTGNTVGNVLSGGAGADKMSGGDGSDLYYVDNSGDVVSETSSGGGSGDKVYSALASYTLGANVEHLRLTSAGTASGTGNSLNNILYAGAGNNLLDGVTGSDTASYIYAGAAVTASLATTAAQATGGSGSDTLKNIDNLTGSGHADKLTGNSAANVLDGRDGNDTLKGGSGDDVFLFTTALSASGNKDKLSDFVSGDDRLTLSDDIFTAAGAAGALASSAFRTGTHAADSSDRIVYDAASGQLWYDADGSGAAAQIVFAVLAAGAPLLASDVWIG